MSSWLTEYLYPIPAQEIKIYLYKMSVQDIHKRHQENGKISFILSKANNGQLIVFYEQLLASFEPIQRIPEELQALFLKKEYRPIDLTSSVERTVLERLLLAYLGKQQNNKKIRYQKGIGFKHIEGKWESSSGIEVYPRLKIDVTVRPSGDIILGFNMSHLFQRKEHLGNLLQKNMVSPGSKVIDRQRHTRFSFIKVDTRKVGDVFEEIGKSLLDYYRDLGQEHLIKQVHPDTYAVQVETPQGQQLFYIPNLLTLECSYDSLPSKDRDEIICKIKLDADTKMRQSIKLFQQILRAVNIGIHQHRLYAETLGYNVQKFTKPSLHFGRNHTNNNIYHGLNNGGVIVPSQEPVYYCCIFDQNLIQQMKAGNKIPQKFFNKLESVSLSWGVPLQRVTLAELGAHDAKDSFSFKDTALLARTLKKMNRIFKENHLAFFIADKPLLESAYSTVKQELTGRAAIATQGINIETMEKALDQKGGYILANTLLGIYAKSGIQPWVLAERLRADAYIGIDVSHEDGRHTTGIASAVGHDGSVLFSRPLSSTEAGEAIRIDTLKDIINEAIVCYEQRFHVAPERLVFHRDGRCREDIDALLNFAAQSNLEIDYVEVIKNHERRMARFVENTDGKHYFQTQIGDCYSMDDTAYLCTTEPHPRVGMAVPVKIRRAAGTTDIRVLAEEVFRLSFMHIGSILQPRLPITTFFADLSSTSASRGWLPMSSDELKLYFV